MANKRTRELYGKPVQGAGGVLAESIAEVIRCEIYAGRWSIGERLPSYNDLVAMSGSGMAAVREAMDTLAAEGFIERVGQKGSFLKASHPGEGGDLGHVAVVVGQEDHMRVGRGAVVTETFGLWETNALRRHAEEMRLSSDIAILTGGRSSVVSATRPNFRGVISLAKEEQLLSGLEGVEDMPVVYLGVEDPDCTPCVAGNPTKAMGLLTRHLIEHGHRDIAVFAPGNWDEHLLEGVVGGHVRAMKRSGLTVVDDAIRSSRETPYPDVAGVKDFMETFSDATAFIAMSIDIAQKIVETADLLGIRIPEDVSLVSLQTGRLRSSDGGVITGAAYDWERIVKACFDVLLGAEKYSGLSRIVFEPLVIAGTGSAAPASVKDLRV